MEGNEKAHLKVFRFDPTKDKGPQYKTYQIPYQGLSVLQVLKHIYENEDPTLAFRFGCDGVGPARCGGCVLQVNDIPALACQKMAEKEMVIKPHNKFRIIKDLIVDFEKKRPVEEREKGVTTVRTAVDENICVGCGDCVFICPVDVYEMRKGKAFPVDVESCCGKSCRLCIEYCWKNAITLIELQEKNNI